MNATALINPAGEVKAHCCGKCGRVWPNDGGSDTGFAAKCCAPKICSVCGKETNSPRLRCEPCQMEYWFQAGNRMRESDYEGHFIFCEEGYGAQDGYFENVDALRDYCEDDDTPLPKFVFGCTERVWDGIDVDRAIENDLEEFHEDAMGDVRDLAELHAFMKTWNAKQCIPSYYVDYKQVIVLDESVQI
jgi:hypothetical protein